MVRRRKTAIAFLSIGLCSMLLMPQQLFAKSTINFSVYTIETESDQDYVLRNGVVANFTTDSTVEAKTENLTEYDNRLSIDYVNPNKPGSGVSPDAGYAMVAEYNITISLKNCPDGALSNGVVTLPLPSGYDATTAKILNTKVSPSATTETSISFPVTADVSDNMAFVSMNIEYKKVVQHAHSFGSEWVADDTKHWHECSCGQKTDEADHIAGDWIIDKQATTTETGSRHKECTVCKKRLATEEIPVIAADPVVPEDDQPVVPEDNQPVVPEDNQPVVPDTGEDTPAVVGTEVTFEKDENGVLHCYNAEGTMVTNRFACDGTYTYYFQADGSPMTNSLTYHPDGVKIIYLDAEGHEVFDNFALVTRSISGEEVSDICFFDSTGNLYVDVTTYDQQGKNLYYMNASGVMEHEGWFQFSNGDTGFANYDGSLMVSQFSYDLWGRVVYFQGNGALAKGLIFDGNYYYHMDEEDGHLLGMF